MIKTSSLRPQGPRGHPFKPVSWTPQWNFPSSLCSHLINIFTRPASSRQWTFHPLTDPHLRASTSPAPQPQQHECSRGQEAGRFSRQKSSPFIKLQQQQFSAQVEARPKQYTCYESIEALHQSGRYQLIDHRLLTNICTHGFKCNQRDLNLKTRLQTFMGFNYPTRQDLLIMGFKVSRENTQWIIMLCQWMLFADHLWKHLKSTVE